MKKGNGKTEVNKGMGLESNRNIKLKNRNSKLHKHPL